MNDPIKQLKELHKLKEQGILTQEEFDQQKQSLLTQNLSHEKIARPVETSTSMELMAGVDIGARGRQFRLVKQIGRGGMGQVWQARDLAEEAAFSEEPIYKALKVVNANMMHSSGAIKKLQKEAINVAKLSHPNIINVNGWHQGEEGWLFVEMEYLQGEDLESYLSDYDDGLSWKESLPILQAVADGLHYAHTQHKLIHRDLKPGNIFITKQQQIKILDFGLAYRLRKSSMSNAQQADTSGVAEYMPPEAFLAGKPDSRHDVYAFACLTYELLTGEPPYSREKAVNRGENEWPPKPEKLTEGAWDGLKNGLAYKKEQRVKKVQDLLNTLKSAQIIQKEKVKSKDASKTNLADNLVESKIQQKVKKIDKPSVKKEKKYDKNIKSWFLESIVSFVINLILLCKKKWKVLVAAAGIVAVIAGGIVYKEYSDIADRRYKREENKIKKAAQLLVSASNGNAEAQYKLGQKYFKGRGVVENKKTAVEWFTKSADQGFTSAQRVLGYMYRKGEGVPENFKLAMKWSIKAYMQGDKSSLSTYSWSKFRPKDSAELTQERKNAERGDPKAQYNLGIIYAGFDSRSYGITRNTEEGIEWLTKAANQDFSPAHLFLYEAYRFGRYGVVEDKKTAHKWLHRAYLATKKAAENGDSSAQLKMGIMYKKDLFIIKDAEQDSGLNAYTPQGRFTDKFEEWVTNEGAAKWFLKAFKSFKIKAEQNNFIAQTQLGSLYDHGYGVEKNKDKAIEWYIKSLENIDAEQPDHLNILPQILKRLRSIDK